jgi:hypothetical protein
LSPEKNVKGICRMLQLGDNVAIHAMDASPDEALPEVGNSARELSRYLNDSRLQLAPEKCKLCIFKNKRPGIEKEWVININGKKITSEKAVITLGLYFEANQKI